jgi:hypothetical protein
LAAATTSERDLEALSERNCRHNNLKGRYFLKIFTEKFGNHHQHTEIVTTETCQHLLK